MKPTVDCHIGLLYEDVLTAKQRKISIGPLLRTLFHEYIAKDEATIIDAELEAIRQKVHDAELHAENCKKEYAAVTIKKTQEKTSSEAEQLKQKKAKEEQLKEWAKQAEFMRYMDWGEKQ